MRIPVVWLMRVSLVVHALLLPASAMAGPMTILRVDQNAPGIVTDGASWSTAYIRLEAALSVASSGTEVRVADGIYRPDNGSGDRSAHFSIPDGVAVLGGFAGFGAPNPNHRDVNNLESVLEGDIGIPGHALDNAYHVVRFSGGGPGTVLSGFTVRNGHADGSAPDERGAGAVITLGAPLIESCKFSYNRAGTGGALYLSSGVTPLFVGCTFYANASTGNGGAVAGIGPQAVYQFCSFTNNTSDVSGGAAFEIFGSSRWENCTFTSNTAVIYGGAVYSTTSGVTFLDCLLSQNIQSNNVNVSFEGGGALHIDGGGVVLRRCEMRDNLAGDDGGALFAVNATVLLEQCRLLANWCGNYGGAIYSTQSGVELRSCVLNGNTATVNGGALYNNGGAPMLRRSTVVQNRAIGWGGGIQTSAATLQVDSSILYENLDTGGSVESSQIRLISGTVDARYSCVQGWTGIFGGIGNIPGPPLLVDRDGLDNLPGTADDDLRLQPTSPCINGGDPLMVPPAEVGDVTGAPRVQGCRVDMGAYEFVTGPPHTADLDASGFIDGHDARLFTGALLGTGPPAYQCVADLDIDGDVDFDDLDIFVGLCLGV